MINDNILKHIFKGVSIQLKDSSEEEYNEVLSTLEEMLNLYFLKHNGNRKRLFMIKIMNEDYNMIDSVKFVLAYNKRHALLEFGRNSVYNEYYLNEDENVVDVEEELNHKILVLKD